MSEYDFKCSGCKKVHRMASRAIAQLVMGNVMIFTCECQAKTTLKPALLRRKK